MNEQQVIEYLKEISTLYLQYNYDYSWLKTMLDKASIATRNSTLITGSSHALNGIYEPVWENAINCSMHSQDIYYDYALTKNAINNGGHFSRCFIVMGYYIAYQDISLSKNVRDQYVSYVYYPLLGDSHNWNEPNPAIDPWRFLPEASDLIKKKCEEIVKENILEAGTYYSRFIKRGSFFDFGEKKWKDLSSEERDYYGKKRATSHNKLFKHKDTYTNNIIIMKDYIKLLYDNDIVPIIVITPFTKEYNKYVNKDMKHAIVDMLNEVSYDVHLADFNESNCFDNDDFMDTDHLNEKGAKKVSQILVEMFGR